VMVSRRRAPRTGPHQTPPEITRLLVAARRAHPSWGPRTLLGWLAGRHPELPWPAPSTAGDLLKRLGLVKKRRRVAAIVSPQTGLMLTQYSADISSG
jgi:hypothetical protein